MPEEQPKPIKKKFIASENKMASGRYVAAVGLVAGSCAVAIGALIIVGIIVVGVCWGHANEPMPLVQAMMQLLVAFLALTGQAVAFYFGTKAKEPYSPGEQQ